MSKCSDIAKLGELWKAKPDNAAKMLNALLMGF